MIEHYIALRENRIERYFRFLSLLTCLLNVTRKFTYYNNFPHSRSLLSPLPLIRVHIRVQWLIKKKKKKGKK